MMRTFFLSPILGCLLILSSCQQKPEQTETKEGIIREITLGNSASPAASTKKRIAAKMFIDCSYEGDLMARAGVSYTVGRESNDTYNEDYNGVQLMEGHQFPDGVDLYTRGLLYFYGHDQRVPEALRHEMQQWGYPKDEYVDNGHWSPQLYIRECRRMIGSYVMAQANCQGREVAPDGAAYTMDSHNCQRIVVNGMARNEGNVEIGGFGPYPISYRSIGGWQKKTSEQGHGYTGNYGPSMLAADGRAAGQEVRFIPDIPAAGQYELYAYFPKVPRSSAKTHVVVFDGNDSKEVFIDNSAIQVEGQTSGEWAPLGTFALPQGRRPYVAVTNKGADGTVVADAVLFVPAR